MLKFVRDAQRSWFIKFVLLVIAASFVLGFGMMLAPTSPSGGAAGEVIVEVENEKIFVSDFLNATNRLRQIYRERAGEAYAQLQDYFEQQIPQAAWDQLIESRLALVAAEHAGFAASDEEIRRLIVDNPNFQVEGKFSAELYREYVQRLRMTVGEFEYRMRRELALQKARAFLAAQVKVSEAELQQVYYDENTKATIEAFIIDGKDLAGEIEVPDAEVQAYYDEHTVDFFQPERRKLDYIVFDASRDYLGKVDEISDEAVREFYASEKGERFVLTERNWRVREIVASVRPEGAKDQRTEEERKEAARKRIEQAQARLEAGEPFEAVANRLSESLAVQRTKSGGLVAGGYVTAGYFKRSVFEAFRDLKPGERTGIVFEPGQGYHIAEVVEVFEPGAKKKLEDVSETIRTLIRQERAAELAKADAEAAAAEAKQAGSVAAFANASEKYKLKEATVSQEGVLPGLGRVPDLMTQIFTEITVEDVPKLLDANGRWVLVDVSEVIEPAPAPLTDVRAEIVEILRKDKIEVKARALAAEIRGKLVGGAGVATLNRDYDKLVVEDIGPFARVGRESVGQESGVDVIPELGKAPTLKAAVFALEGEGAVTEAYGIGEGRVAFARLKKRTEANADGFRAAREMLYQRIVRSRRQAVYEDWLNQARQKIVVKVRVPLEQLVEQQNLSS